VKKKFPATAQDKKDWFAFTQKKGKIYNKESELTDNDINKNKITKLDLHGESIDEANKKVKEFIIKSFDLGYRKIKIITGKGSRSNAYNNVYRSKKMSILKNSVPEYIQNNEDLLNIIKKTEETPIKDGGEGAIFIYLKNKF
jgi:DNA-nicking Smr family endonuclease